MRIRGFTTRCGGSTNVGAVRERRQWQLRADAMGARSMVGCSEFQSAVSEPMFGRASRSGEELPVLVGSSGVLEGGSGEG